VAAETIARGAAELSVPIDPRQTEQLAHFAELLVRWNRRLNLISKADEPRVVPRHVLDALSAATYLRGPRVVDLGTGAGLPGVPLAVVRPELEFTLLDRHERRLTFVRQATIELGLANVECVQTDMAQYRPTALFDTVVSRAVRDPVRMWQVAQRLLRDAGRAVLFCGPDAEMPSELDRGVRLATMDAVVPGLERRHRLLVIDRA
jgi:16S rRNA (guanine527-N7)-methyltransferase